MVHPEARRALLEVFAAINRRDEAGFIALFAPEVDYFGSMTGTATQGRSALRGVFRASVDVVGFTRIEPLEIYGNRREFAVRCALHFEGGAGGVVEQVMHFRFGDRGFIEDYGIYWDAVDFLARRAAGFRTPAGPEGRLQGEARAFLEAYVDTYNRGDLEAHLRVLDPGLQFFGSVSEADIRGHSGATGVFKSAREALGIHRLEPVRTYGAMPRFAVRMAMRREGGEGTQGVWIMSLTPAHRLERLSILWDPLPFLLQP